MLIQVAVPLVVLLLNASRKAADRKAGLHDPERSALNNTAWSDPVVMTSNNLANQSQLPVLFYVVCIIFAITDTVSGLVLALAWLFVASRILHAYAHVMGNNVPVRFRAFLVGAIVLIVLYILCLISLVGVS